MSKEQQPNKVDPAENDTCRDRDDGEDQRQQLLGLKERRPTYAKLDYPVHARDKEQNELHQKVLLIKPFSHKKPPNKNCDFIIL